MYITLHLIQNVNISTDESIHDLVKKLADGSLILYDLHRFRLYVPEQPLRIIQPRNLGKYEYISFFYDINYIKIIRNKIHYFLTFI